MGVEVFIYEYHNCLYAASVITDNKIYMSPLYTTFSETIIDAVTHILNKKKYAFS